MKKPKISVIMSIYKESKKQIENSINSILKQTFKDFEFIIILDEPKNKIAIKLINDFMKKDKRIILLKNKKNIGLGFSLNKGIKISIGKYIARMDCGDLVKSNKLKIQYNYMEKNKQIDLLFTQWIEINENGEKTIRKPQKIWFKNMEKNFFLKSMLLHASLMCKSEILKKYNYEISQRPEDFILFLRLIRKKYKFDLIEENLYIYNIDNILKINKFKKINEYSKNMIKCLFKNTYFFYNIYFWFYFFRILLEFLLSRNYLIFRSFYYFFEKIGKLIIK